VVFVEHAGTKTLATKRLLLRRFNSGDAQAMYDNWASDPEVTKYLMWPAHQSVGVTKNVLRDWISQYGDANFYQWAITVKENGDEPVGSISVVQRDDRVKMVHIGYCIGKKWWRQGIMSEALTVVMAFFFDVVGVNRIESRHDPNNPNSGKVMLKCGMRYEGTKREADWNNQGICDSAMYAILKKDRNPRIYLENPRDGAPQA
jgi:ribosomal-protein-alanine N-acetyltransferase